MRPLALLLGAALGWAPPVTEAKVRMMLTLALLLLTAARADVSPWWQGLTTKELAAGTPSFLFILGDDIGWGDFRYNNGTSYTPNVDTWVAKQGTLIMQDLHSGGKHLRRLQRRAASELGRRDLALRLLISREVLLLLLLLLLLLQQLLLRHEADPRVVLGVQLDALGQFPEQLAGSLCPHSHFCTQAPFARRLAPQS